ncbi:MAG: hypothetical protein SCH71_03885 [Desulfobulbaceae bacterium]|nr:hypothetical protein [Desulfobulbaceae bacterium]
MTKKTFYIGAFLAVALCLCFPGPPAHALEAHENIKGLFNTPGDVVIKCLECHKQRASEVLQSTHWTWERHRMVNGRQVMYGKKDSLAAFALDVASNPTRCLRCHISSTPEISVFEQGAPADVDCLVCHDTTGVYVRQSEGNGLEQADFETIAHNVGKPGPVNCMACHFADCGLTGSRPDAETKRRKLSFLTDVHMNGEATFFTCQTCHEYSGHLPAGAGGHTSGMNMPGQGCISCHTASPHLIMRLNQHAEFVSCSTCHIPEYASRIPAIVNWDWVLAGRIRPVSQSLTGSETLLQDSNGFTSSGMIRPFNVWDDGSDLVYTRGQRIKPQETTWLQKPAERNRGSKIAPFRILYGTQLYDAKYRYLISPLLSAAGEELFPGSDWDAVAREGMKAIVLPYSGEYGFAPTAAYRRLNHGVAPAANALGCMDCHGSSSRIDWEALGYDQDPWSGKQSGQPAVEPLQENSITEETEPIPPVQDLQFLPAQ